VLHAVIERANQYTGNHPHNESFTIIRRTAPQA
jgi:hypothetical protein